MTTMHPSGSGGSLNPEKLVRPIFPPTANMNGNSNGLLPSLNASQMSTQNSPLTRPPIFPPSLQSSQTQISSQTAVNSPNTNGKATPTLPPVFPSVLNTQSSMSPIVSTLNSSISQERATPTPPSSMVSTVPRYSAPVSTTSDQHTRPISSVFGQQPSDALTTAPSHQQSPPIWTPASFNQQVNQVPPMNNMNQPTFQPGYNASDLHHQSGKDSPSTSLGQQAPTTNSFYQQFSNNSIGNNFNQHSIQQTPMPTSTFTMRSLPTLPHQSLMQQQTQSTSANTMLNSSVQPGFTAPGGTQDFMQSMPPKIPSQLHIPTPPVGNMYQPSTNFPNSTVRPMYPSQTSPYRAPIPTQPPPPPLPGTIPTQQPPLPTNSTLSSAPVPNFTNQNFSSYPGQSNGANPTSLNHTGFGAPPLPGNSMLPPGATNQSMTNTNGPPANNELIDLLKEKCIVSPFSEEPPISPLLNEENQQMNCNPEVMRCSLNVIPQTKEILQKTRLPLGILIHPFKDLESLSVIQGTRIVRCDSCKSYINPFVTFLDNTRWRCSICFRVNDLPQEFLFDPITKTYGDPSRRPEVRFGTVEYTATADYMARPPQPAMYLFLLDVSHNAVHTGYLQSFCDTLLESLSLLPGDARTQIGFICYDSRLHFFDLSDRQNGMFRVMILPEIDQKAEDFLPLPDGLMVTLCDSRSVIETFLKELPRLYQDNHEVDSALGSALLVAQKLLQPTGGRVTVIQTRLPNLNPGALNDTSNFGSKSKELPVIKPTSDFYKKLSLEFASLQIACDLFLLNSHHVDLATLNCIGKYSGGEIKYYPDYHSLQKPHEVERFENDLRRYLQRKIGFEAVMRLRCPQALSIHTFYGNCFVRSVDLLVLPNINPDAAFGIQVSIEDSLASLNTITFQAALLYTSSKGERRIRVHTLSLPVSSNVSEILANADQEAVVSLIAKMASDRSTASSVQEAREAIANVAVDIVKSCITSNASNRVYSLMVPYSLRLIPLYMLSMIKSVAFRAANVAKTDDRAYHIESCRTLPLQYLIQTFYPDLYPIHTIEEKSQVIQDGEDELHIPQRTHLSYQHIDSHGAYILDTSEYIYIYIGKAISDHFIQSVFNVPTFSALPHDSYSLPEFENSLSMKIHNFLSYLIQSRPHGVGIHIMREDSSSRYLFTRHLVDDKSESTMSYVEFLRYIREHISK